MDDFTPLDESPPRPRRVFVLGRRAILDVEAVVRRVVAEGAELVLLSLGHPQTTTQAAAVGDALRLAAEIRLWLDTVLLTAPEEVADLVLEGDEVIVLASGSERRRIERALGTKVRRWQAEGPVLPAMAPYQTQLQAPRARRARARAGSVEPRTPSTVAGGDGEPPETGAGIGSHNGHVSEDAELATGLAASESVEALAGREVAQPVLDTVWTKEEARARKRAPLRVYLGAAPGVGKTFAMLGEGQRRRARGTDVVVGIVQTYDRPKTIEMLQGLEIVPPRTLEYRGTTFEEMDIDAVIERRPEVALIDELAHTNIPGSRRAKRWEDVLDLLAEGITVVTTVNVQHLASLNDVVAEITGIRQQETVPDWVLDLTDQVELVDMSPHALQRRMVHGNVYPDPRKAELALRRFFTMENLTALRELALMRVANQVDEELLARWSKASTPETRERVLVCVSRPDVSEELVSRGGRIAQRTRGDLLVIHVITSERGPDPEWVAQVQRLVQDLGGEFQILEAEDPVEGVLSFAYQQHVTQILVGESLRPRWQELVRGSFVNRLIQKASKVDVHVIARRER
jgi:nucleotide-binding universal stress UspA family protein